MPEAADPAEPMTDETTGAHVSEHSTTTQDAAQQEAELDSVLAAAQEMARAALLELVPAQEIGQGHRAVADGELLVTHCFPSGQRGYRGWEWYVTLTRTPDSQTPTVCESGMLPGPHALLAPEWLPWSERVRDDDEQHDDDAPDHETPQDSVPESESEDEPEVQPEAEPAARPEPEAAAEPEPEAQPEAAAEPEAQSEAQPEAESEAQPEPAGEVRAAAEPEPASVVERAPSSSSSPQAPEPAATAPVRARRARGTRRASTGGTRSAGPSA